MGEAIDAVQNAERHRELSKNLSAFVERARVIVEEGGTLPDGTSEKGHGGSLVYAGGDDVLAFLPLHRALFCARRLADAFRVAMQSYAFDDAKNVRRWPTLSVGIAVRHHLDPLSDTLELAREAERTAKKKVKEKNALAVVVSKRSGVDWTVKGSWDGETEGLALDARLNDFIRLDLAGALPRGLGYELRDAALRLGGPKLDAALRDEAVRIARRKRTEGGSSALTEEVFAKLEGYLRNTHLTVAGLADELIVARPFAGAFRQAGVDAEAFAAQVAEVRATDAANQAKE